MPVSSRDADPVAAADLAACQATFNEGSRTFFAASFLLPRAIRRDASALYAFCRMADDAVDRGGGGRETLDRLSDRLDRIYAGRPLGVPSDRAFAGVVARHSIPRSLLEGLLEGFAWDAAGRRYETLPELLDYAARVAGTVGAMMAVIMDRRAPATIARASELGIAMQLTNIARDVGEDARAGRLYLPRSWLEDEGIDPDTWLAAPAFNQPVGRCVQRLLDTADAMYRRSEVGIADLPWRCRAGIRAARALYDEIGREVARRGFDSVGGRAVVSPSRKAAVLSRRLATPLATARAEEAIEPLPATLFLVAAAAAPPRRVPLVGRPAWWRLDQRFVSVIDLFERLERRDTLGETEAP
jgi:phytoene synthase